ncbi:MAG TPA: response regulator [Acidobacteriaceae bacterium]|nr:response regulator [Acidobacteriaceae bacterium]
MTDKRLVYILDDDVRVCSSLKSLLGSLGLDSVSFHSAQAYTSYRKQEAVSCLLLDINLPDANGLVLQQELDSSENPPIIFLTGYGDIASSVQAMKRGAIDFLPKPFQKSELLRAINEAFEKDMKSRMVRAELSQLHSRYSSLTPREREVLPLIVAGYLNKQTAAVLGIREITCQVHRAQIMKKMSARSLADLVRMATKLEVPLPAFYGEERTSASV